MRAHERNYRLTRVERNSCIWSVLVMIFEGCETLPCVGTPETHLLNGTSCKEATLVSKTDAIYRS